MGELFSAHQPSYNSQMGNLAKFSISKGEAGGKPSVRVTSLEINPIYLYRNKQGEHCADFRILDMRRLAAGLRTGGCPFKFSKNERKVVLRLERLMRKLFGPALK